MFIDVGCSVKTGDGLGLVRGRCWSTQGIGVSIMLFMISVSIFKLQMTGGFFMK